MENDYSHIELINIIDELINIHRSKLKKEELLFVYNMFSNLQSGHQLSQEQRDTLIKLYDGVRDIPGE